jgi:hypothetical protein
MSDSVMSDSVGVEAVSSASERWAAMQPRERDAWVAEHVMGWSQCNPHFEWSSHGTGVGVSPWDEFATVIPGYTTDAAADYLVLERVREMQEAGTPVADWEDYLDALYSEFSGANVRPRISGYRPYECIAKYTVGAYSRAAWMAVEGGGSRGDEGESDG